MLYIILIIVLLLLVIGGLPHWPYATAWGYGYWPSGVGGLLVIVLLVLLLTGRL